MDRKFGLQPLLKIVQRKKTVSGRYQTTDMASTHVGLLTAPTQVAPSARRIVRWYPAFQPRFGIALLLMLLAFGVSSWSLVGILNADASVPTTLSSAPQRYASAPLLAPPVAPEKHIGEFRIVVVPGFFPDIPLLAGQPALQPRLSRAEVLSLLTDEVNNLWNSTSYGKVSIKAEVAEPIILNWWGDDCQGEGDPWPRAKFTNTRANVMGGGPIRQAAACNARRLYQAADEATKAAWNGNLPTLWDADRGDFAWDKIDGFLAMPINPPQLITYTNTTPEIVYDGETLLNRPIHSMAASHGCNAATFGGPRKSFGCGYIMQGLSGRRLNDGTYVEKLADLTWVWGAWAHEIGHMMENTNPSGHPSNYQSNFELMDSNVPGRTGVFVNSVDAYYPGWLPDERMRTVTTEEAGAFVSISAAEYPLPEPDLAPFRAAKIALANGDYYLVSVRRRILGDDLAGGSPDGIPDEGVLIERVREARFDTVVHETACPALANFVLAPGEYCTVEVRFVPNGLGPRTTTLVLDVQTATGPQTVETVLIGRGVDENPQPAGEGAETQGAVIALSPLSHDAATDQYRYDFGAVVSNTAVDGRLRLTNIDSEPRLVQRIAFGCGGAGEPACFPSFQLGLDFDQQCPWQTGKYQRPPCGAVRVMGNQTINANESRNVLWHVDDVFDSSSFTGWFPDENPGQAIRTGSRFWRNDGIRIEVTDTTTDTYGIYITRQGQPGQPDMMVRPWRSNPEPGAYESTDIWIDSPVNGYCGGGEVGEQINPPDAIGLANCLQEYTRGVRTDPADPFYGTVIGNGDTPAVGLPNRIYARLRNVGDAAAENITVHFDLRLNDETPGLGIGPGAWQTIGTLTPADLARLARIEPDSYTDVYLEWTPPTELFPADAAGRFRFHACIRIRLEVDESKERILSNHTVTVGADSEPREQENIDYFEVASVADSTVPVAPYHQIIRLHNFDTEQAQLFDLAYTSDLPASWTLVVNGGASTIGIGPSGTLDIPIFIQPSGDVPVPGSTFQTNLSATYQRLLTDELDETDTHLDNALLGGVTFQTEIKSPTEIEMEIISGIGRNIQVQGRVKGVLTFVDDKTPPVFLIGLNRQRKPLPATMNWLTMNSDGTFSGTLKPAATASHIVAGQGAASEDDEDVYYVVALFAGSPTVASSSSGYQRAAAFRVLLPNLYRLDKAPTPLPTATPTATPSGTPIPTKTYTPVPTLAATAVGEQSKTPTVTPTPSVTPTSKAPTSTATTTSTPTVDEKMTSTPTVTSTATPAAVRETKTLYAVADAQVQDSTADTNFGSETAMLAGNEYGSALYRAYARFDTSVLPAGATVISATVHISQTNSFGDSATYQMDLYRADSFWSETSLTWNNQPARIATGQPIAVNTSGGRRTWNATALVQYWLDHENFGFALGAVDEAEQSAREFDTREGGQAAELIVIYDYVP